MLRLLRLFPLLIAFLLLSSSEVMSKEGASASGVGQSHGRYIGLQLGRALTHFEEIPEGFESNDLEPPVLTLDFDYRMAGDRFFNFYIAGHLSVLNGFGPPQIGGRGGILFKPTFFWFGGGFHVNYYSLPKEPYDNSQYDYDSYGLDFEAGADLVFISFGAKLRLSEFTEGDLGRTEGLETLIAHKGDKIYHLWVETKLLHFIWLRGSYINYNLGVTSIASKEFSTHLEETDFSQVLLEVGIPLPKLQLWFKYMKTSDIGDQIAHAYQGVYFFPYYTLAEEAAFVEARWTF